MEQTLHLIMTPFRKSSHRGTEARYRKGDAGGLHASRLFLDWTPPVMQRARAGYRHVSVTYGRLLTMWILRRSVTWEWTSKRYACSRNTQHAFRVWGSWYEGVRCYIAVRICILCFFSSIPQHILIFIKKRPLCYMCNPLIWCGRLHEKWARHRYWHSAINT